MEKSQCNGDGTNAESPSAAVSSLMMMMMMMAKFILLANVLSNAPAARDRMVRGTAS